MLRFLSLLVVLTLVLTPVSMVATAQGDDLPELTLFLGFIPNIQFSPLYVALEKGYFAEAGVNVVLEYGNENIGVERIAAGELQFGIISGEQVILARAGGRPLVYVFEWWQRFPVGVVAPLETGIESVTDLAGRTVGIPGRFGASYVGLRALLAANGLTEDDIQLEEIGFNALAVICAGGVEASVIYLANEPTQIREQCADVNVIEIAPVVDLVANGLITNEETVANNPELVRGMVSALSRGLADTIADPDEAMRLSRRYVETLPSGSGSRLDVSIAATDALRMLQAIQSDEPPDGQTLAAMIETLDGALENDEVVQMRVLRNSIALWDAPRLGETDPASWETTMAALVEVGLLSGPIDLDSAYTNDFLPQ